MKCGHLFNGIGGFALSAHWMGWQNVFHCEIDDFCNKVMHKHFPNSIQHGDIKEQDFSIYRGTIDVLTGGFPCQPYSTAGKRKGKEDDRHLWPQMLRAIREISPCWVVGENVRGLTNWNGGLVFDEVQADMEAEGYEVLPFLLPACAVNAPHRRDRIWFIAHAISDGHRSDKRFEQTGCQKKETEGKEQWKERNEIQWEWDGSNVGGIGTEDVITNPNNIDGRNRAGGKNGQEINNTDQPITSHSNGISEERREYEIARIWQGANGNDRRDTWIRFPTQPPLCGRDDGIPHKLAPFTVPKKRGGSRALNEQQTFGKWRNESIKALGNAIVPQVAFELFKAIEQYDHRPHP